MRPQKPLHAWFNPFRAWKHIENPSMHENPPQNPSTEHSNLFMHENISVRENHSLHDSNPSMHENPLMHENPSMHENPLMHEKPSMHENPFAHDSWMKTLSCMIRTFRAWFVHENPSMHENPFMHDSNPFMGESLQTLPVHRTLFGQRENPVKNPQIRYNSWESRMAQNGLALHHEANLFRSSPFGSIQKVWKMFMNFVALILHSSCRCFSNLLPFPIAALWLEPLLAILWLRT